ncbi:MAG TPA: hypothetical protein VHU89_00450 [Acidobacteriaceae bacterium]|jgi:hypothetical protein|nr:hypothetical protein [Acidobacteriaceae bacterium]
MKTFTHLAAVACLLVAAASPAKGQTAKIYQGIPTEVTGEGDSVAPINDRMIAADRASYQHLKITPDWRTMALYACGYFEARDTGENERAST